jgi:protein involved in polysaccharide export with SLBB domain
MSAFMNLRRWLGPVCLALVVLISFPAFSQLNPKTGDVKNLKADSFTDQQLLAWIAQADAAKMTDNDIIQMAVTKGLPAAEIQKFQARIARLRKSNPGKSEVQDNTRQIPGRTYNSNDLSVRDTSRARRDSLTPEQRADVQLRRQIYGADLFSNRNITFEPNLRLATPPDYQIGPDDEILIDIYGNSETNHQLIVSPEGTINIPYVGVVKVGGMTMEQASARIRSQMATIYTAIRNGQTKVSVSLGNIRTIKVIITGEVVTPGTYSVSSLSTVMNALYVSGGPTSNGSLRDIKLIRGGKEIATIDVYEFLETGAFKTNVRLRDQDVIRVPTYLKRVEVGGQVKRPKLFELRNAETFDDLLRYAGGFTNSAYRERVQVIKNTSIQHSLFDLTADQFATYEPAAGDKFEVTTILSRYENRVSISGAVFRPGDYQLEPGMTVKQLVRKADGLREDAFVNRASILRLKDNLQPELIPIDIGQILAGNAEDIVLKREDQIVISSIFDLKEYYTVDIDGEVQRPGRFNYSEGMTLQDLIILAGNLKEGATSRRIEISRRVRNSNALSKSAQIANVTRINISKDLKTSDSTFVLQPFDIVSVRPSPGYQVQRSVRVEGEVLYPGNYVLIKKNETISDLIARAGGFTGEAYTEGASLKRPGPVKRVDSLRMLSFTEQQRRLDRVSGRYAGALSPYATERLSDTTDLRDIDGSIAPNISIGINLPEIMKSPGGKNDIFLEDGDILSIPKQLQTVAVSGEVLSPRAVVFVKNYGFRDYISGAGGFGDRAKRKAAYIQYANGSVKGTRRFLFFTNYPAVKPGAEIFIPLKEEKKSLSAGEIVGLTSGLASLGAIVLGILNLSK